MKEAWKRLTLILVMAALVTVYRIVRSASVTGTDLSLLLPDPDAARQGLAMLVLLAVTTAVLVGIVKVNEFRRQRENEEILLQTRIDDALLAVPGLLTSSVTPTVRIPVWRGSPARIELTGQAPSAYLERLALRAAAQEAARVRPDFAIENHMTTVPPTGTRAAGMKKGERTWQPAALHLRS